MKLISAAWGMRPCITRTCITAACITRSCITRTCITAACVTVLSSTLVGLCRGQDLGPASALWNQTVKAVREGNDARARDLLARFDAAATSYVQIHGRNWQVEYLAGSLDCMFADKRAIGAEFLRDVLASRTTLNQAGEDELRRQIARCTDAAPAPATEIEIGTPPDVADGSTHYQTVGVSGDTKGGGDVRETQEASGVISPIPQAELAARLVSIDQPQKALQDAMARISPSARGDVEDGFVVVSANGSAEQARLTATCLARYAQSLRSEFKIEQSRYMVTAYSVTYSDAVYQYAQKLHGLKLPFGVIAYSVPDDMSLVSPEFGDHCGSMAHELVHLLIKQSFHGAPAWLEEGLASEVAIATPTPRGLHFGWSWRDERLSRDQAEYPLTVADLLDMPWSALSAYDRADARRAESYQAMTAVFIRYLDSRGKLPEIYFAARDQHVSADLSGFTSYREIIEKKLGMPIGAVQADFERWFQSEASAHPALVLHPPMQGGSFADVPNAAPPQADCSAVNVQSVTQAAVPRCAPLNSAAPNAAAEPELPTAPAKPN